MKLPKPKSQFVICLVGIYLMLGAGAITYLFPDAARYTMMFTCGIIDMLALVLLVDVLPSVRLLRDKNWRDKKLWGVVMNCLFAIAMAVYYNYIFLFRWKYD